MKLSVIRENLGSIQYLLIGLDSVFQSLKGGFSPLAFINTTDILSAVGI